VGAISHADDGQSRDKRTGQILGFAEVDDLDFRSPSRRFQIMVQEVGRVGCRQGSKCGGELVGDRTAADAGGL